MGQLCQSETKGKEISSSCLAFVSLTTHTQKNTAEVISEVSHSSILYLYLPIYIATSSHIQTISPPSVIPPTHNSCHSSCTDPGLEATEKLKEGA